MTLNPQSESNKVAKIRNRYNQVPHLTQDTNGKVTTFYVKFKLIQAFMVVLVTCKNGEDPINNEGARVVTIMQSINF